MSEKMKGPGFVEMLEQSKFFTEALRKQAGNSNPIQKHEREYIPTDEI
jgi:hypothetical protein